MNNLTLTYDGTTQSIEAWGFANPKMLYCSRTWGTFSVDVLGGDPAVTPAIPFQGKIVIKQVIDDDTSVIIFVGYRSDNNGSVNGKRRATSLVFSDVYWLIFHTIYQTQWKVTTDGVTFTEEFYPQAWLFQNIGEGSTPWQYWTATQQIVAILDFAQDDCSLEIQAGTIDPPIMMPIYPVNSETIADCIAIVLRTLPDVSSSFDYTTTPPSINYRTRQNCTPITLPWGGTDGSGRKHISSEIKSRDDLQVSEVVIKYRTVSTEGSSAYEVKTSDVYPPGSNGLTPFSTVHSFDLRGAQRNTVQGSVTSVALDPTTTDFWKLIKPDLATDDIEDLALVHTGINDGDPKAITILDSTGAAVTLSDTPNRITAGQVAPWMTLEGGDSVIAKEVTITAYLKYTKLDPSGSVNQTVTIDHQVSWRGKLTNSPAGAINYSTVSSTVGAETPPPGFAYAFWCSQNNVVPNIVDGVPTPPEDVPDIESPENLQWEGWHEIREQVISTFYNCTNTLNLSGGADAWAEMNATIYRVEYDFFTGVTKIYFGPHKSLGLGEYFNLLMMARARVAWDNPAVTGTGATANGTTLGNDTAKENTVEHSTPTRITDSLVGNPDGGGHAWHTEFDAGSNVDDFSGTSGFRMIRRDSTGAQTTGSNLVSMFVSDIDGLELAAPVTMSFKKLTYCVVNEDETQSTKCRVVFCSEEFDP